MNCSLTPYFAAPNLSQPNPSVSLQRSSLPIAPLSRCEPKVPVLRSKAAAYSLPRYPDIAAMRERRDASQISVRTLQRERGVEPIANSAADLHAGMLGADGHGQLADGLMWLSQAGVALLDSVFSRLPDLPSWPPGCTATPASEKAMAIDSFLDRFSKDFDISLTPAARHAADMKGMIIVIGEDHYDPVIQGLVTEVMSEFRLGRGDRFFTEGGQEELCIGRAASYEMPVEACNLLEQGSAVYARGVKLRRDVDKRLGKCVEYLIRRVPGLADASLPAHNSDVFFKFIQRHAPDLPVDAISDFNELVIAANEAIAVSKRELAETLGQRDQSMSAALRRGRSVKALNYAIVGSDHLAGMRDRMKDLPCIFMVPKQIADPVVEPKAKRETKQEL